MNCWAGLGGALEWTDWKYDSRFSSETEGACFAAMVSSIDSRHFQNFVISVFSAESSNWRILALYYSFFLEWSNVLYCVRTAWYSSRKMRSKGSLCFWFLVRVFQSYIPLQTIFYLKMTRNAFVLSQFNFWTLFSCCDENIFYFFKRSVHVVNLCSVAYVLPY